MQILLEQKGEKITIPRAWYFDSILLQTVGVIFWLLSHFLNMNYFELFEYFIEKYIYDDVFKYHEWFILLLIKINYTGVLQLSFDYKGGHKVSRPLCHRSPYVRVYIWAFSNL